MDNRQSSLLVLGAAVAGILAGSSFLGSCSAGDASAAQSEKNGCSGPNGCNGHGTKGAKDANKCSGPNGCNGHGTKEAMKEMNKCSGPNGCNGKGTKGA